MKDEYLKIVRKRMPRKFRLRWISMSIDCNIHPDLVPPTLEQIEVARWPGIFRLFRGWTPIGEIHIDEDVIYIWGEHFSKYLRTFIKVIEPIRPHVTVQAGKSKASERYQQNLGYNREAMRYFQSRSIDPDNLY